MSRYIIKDGRTFFQVLIKKKIFFSRIALQSPDLNVVYNLF